MMLLAFSFVSFALAQAPELKEIEGVYTYLPKAGDAKMVEEQVEKSISDFNPVFRHFARSRLRRGAAIDSTIELQVKNNNVTMIHHNKIEKSVLTIPMNKMVKSNEESGLTHKVQFASKQLSRVDQTSQGGRSVTYKLSKDGKTLFVKFKFFSKFIPKPVKYTLKYVKKLVESK